MNDSSSYNNGNPDELFIQQNAALVIDALQQEDSLCPWVWTGETNPCLLEGSSEILRLHNYILSS